MLRWMTFLGATFFFGVKVSGNDGTAAHARCHVKMHHVAILALGRSPPPNPVFRPSFYRVPPGMRSIHPQVLPVRMGAMAATLAWNTYMDNIILCIILICKPGLRVLYFSLPVPEGARGSSAFVHPIETSGRFARGGLHKTV